VGEPKNKKEDKPQITTQVIFISSSCLQKVNFGLKTISRNGTVTEGISELKLLSSESKMADVCLQMVPAQERTEQSTVYVAIASRGK
jgi:hypothetical protein